jgi:Ca2+/Na+ antiporter
MKKKHYLLLNTFLHGAVALFFLSTPLWMETTEASTVYWFMLLAAVFAYLSFKNFNQIKDTREEDQVDRPDTDDSVADQISFYKKYTYISAIGFSLLSIITFIDLNDLVSGKEEQVRILQPAAFVYEHFEYWPAVFTNPVIGILISLLGVRKIHRLNSVKRNG